MSMRVNPKLGVSFYEGTPLLFNFEGKPQGNPPILGSPTSNPTGPMAVYAKGTVSYNAMSTSMEKQSSWQQVLCMPRLAQSRGAPWWPWPN